MAVGGLTKIFGVARFGQKSACRAGLKTGRGNSVSSNQLVDQGTAQSLGPSPRRQNRLAQVHRAEEEHVASCDHNTSTTILGDALLSSDWMRHTGWMEMFSDMNRLVLLRLAQSLVANAVGFSLGECDGVQIKIKADDERTIQEICLPIDRFFDRCEDTTRHASHSLQRWLHSHHTGKV